MATVNDHIQLNAYSGGISIVTRPHNDKLYIILGFVFPFTYNRVNVECDHVMDYSIATATIDTT